MKKKHMYIVLGFLLPFIFYFGIGVYDKPFYRSISRQCSKHSYKENTKELCSKNILCHDKSAAPFKIGCWDGQENCPEPKEQTICVPILPDPQPLIKKIIKIF